MSDQYYYWHEDKLEPRMGYVTEVREDGSIVVGTIKPRVGDLLCIVGSKAEESFRQGSAENGLNTGFKAPSGVEPLEDVPRK